MILTVSTTTLDRALLGVGYDMQAWPPYSYYTVDDVRCVMSRKRFPITDIRLDTVATNKAFYDALYRPDGSLGWPHKPDYQHWAMTFPNEDDAVWWRLKYG